MRKVLTTGEREALVVTLTNLPDGVGAAGPSKEQVIITIGAGRVPVQKIYLIEKLPLAVHRMLMSLPRDWKGVFALPGERIRKTLL